MVVGDVPIDGFRLPSSDFGHAELLAAFHVLGPVANALLQVEDKVLRARHVMFALALAHVVHGAVLLVLVVADEAVLLLAHHFVFVCKGREKHKCIF